jgi:hypothetical protein
MRWPLDLKPLDELVMHHKKMAGTGVLVALVAIMAGPALLDISYVNRMPTNPDPASGRTQWMSLMHGHEMYVTIAERKFHQVTMLLLYNGFAVMMGAGMWLQRRYFAEEQAREDQFRKGFKLREEIELLRREQRS